MSAAPDSADLRALAAEAAEVDRELGAGPGPEASGGKTGEGAAAAPAPDQAAAVAQALELAVAVLAPMFPSLRQVYTPETIKSVAEVTAALARKHGWDLSMTRWQEEIAFVAVVLPVGVQTYQAVLHDLEARRARPPEGGADKGKGNAGKAAAPSGPYAWMESPSETEPPPANPGGTA